MRRSIGLAFLLAAFASPSFDAASASTLSFAFTDPAGDSQADGGDLTGMSFVFDDVTGDYTITFTADAAHPFSGQIRLNVNLFDPDTGSTYVDPAFFQDTGNDFDLATPTTTLVLTGTNTRLTSWGAGDRVAANQYPFGTASGDGSEFYTQLTDLPLQGAGCGAHQDCLGPLDTTNFVYIAPEPTSAILVAGGLAALGRSRRVRRESPL
jgi:hypothetical protein